MGLWDLQIGNKYGHASAVKVFNIKDDEFGDISENSDEYWIGNTPNLNLSGRIDKHCKTGEILKELIDNNHSAEKIYDYVEASLFKIVSLVEMRAILENAKNDSYRAGRESKVEEFRDLFNV